MRSHVTIFDSIILGFAANSRGKNHDGFFPHSGQKERP
jgi:hypothetical protein